MDALLRNTEESTRSQPQIAHMQRFHPRLQVLRMAIVDHHIIGQCQALCAAGLGGDHLVRIGLGAFGKRGALDHCKEVIGAQAKEVGS